MALKTFSPGKRISSADVNANFNYVEALAQGAPTDGDGELLTPAAHHQTHSSNGSDPIAPDDIGAVPTGPLTGSGLTIATGKLAGRSTAGTGALQEIAIGEGLELSAGTLKATATGGAGVADGSGRTQKDVSGGANIALTAAEASNGTLQLSGTLNTNITVTIPDSVLGQIYVVADFTGSGTLTLKKVSQSGGYQFAAGVSSVVTITPGGIVNQLASLAAVDQNNLNHIANPGSVSSSQTLGSLVRKIEIFDANGASLGFIPVYNYIT